MKMISTLTVVMAFVGAVVSQEPVSSTWPTPGRLDNRVREMRAGRVRLSDLPVPPAFPAARERTPLTPLRERLAESQRRRKLEYQGIRTRLDRLETILSSRNAMIPEPPPLTIQRPDAEKNEKPIAEAKPTAVPDEPITPDREGPADSPAPTVLTDSAVDRLALADNLFASGQIDVALKLYLELSNEADEAAARSWVHFQIAACSRRLGQYDQARKHYRIVAGQPADGFYARLARWWLGTIERRLTHQQQLDEVETVLRELEAGRESEQRN